METPSWEESRRIRFTGKIDCLCLPVFNFIQVTGWTAADPRRNLGGGQVNEIAGGSEEFSTEVSGPMKKPAQLLMLA